MYVSVSERFIECVNFLLESRQLRNQAELDYTEEALSWGMGHKTGHRVTEIYIHRSDAKCDEANRAVIDYLWGKETVPHLTT